MSRYSLNSAHAVRQQNWPMRSSSTAVPPDLDQLARAPPLPPPSTEHVSSSNSRWSGMERSSARKDIARKWTEGAHKSIGKSFSGKRPRRHTRTPELELLLDSPPQQPGTMRINVSGKVFDISQSVLEKFPNCLFNSPDMENYYNPEIGVYFLDRNRAVFEQVLMYFYSDKEFYPFPECLPPELLEMELEFYRIGWRFFLGTFDNQNGVFDLKFRTLRERAYAFLNYPDLNKFSKAYMWMDLVFIIGSIFEFIAESEPVIQAYLHEEEQNAYHIVFSITKWVFLIFFTGDIVARAICDLDRLGFWLDYTVWLDIISVIPFYVDLWPSGKEDLTTLEAGDSSPTYYNLLKIARISRCLKIVRRSEKLLMIIDILVGCTTELVLLSFIWCLGVLISGTVLYYAENVLVVNWYNNATANWHLTSVNINGTSTKIYTPWFYSIMESCWQAVVVIGTVGYGNVYPVYAAGKLITSCIIFLSSILMAIPMTIIIKRFSESYEINARENRLRKVFGGKFTEEKVHVKTFEKRMATAKRIQIAASIQKYRENKTVTERVKQWLGAQSCCWFKRGSVLEVK